VIRTDVSKIDWYNITIMAYNKGGIRNTSLTLDISFAGEEIVNAIPGSLEIDAPFNPKNYPDTAYYSNRSNNMPLLVVNETTFIPWFNTSLVRYPVYTYGVTFNQTEYRVTKKWFEKFVYYRFRDNKIYIDPNFINCDSYSKFEFFIWAETLSGATNNRSVIVDFSEIVAWDCYLRI
jgi:hypothetical protein